MARLVIAGGQIRAAALSTGHESRRRLIAQKKIRITAGNHNGMMVEQ
ncbi:hypothetical protein ACK31Z_17500 [Aeromonas dhakensis]|nr:hypothetical protein [Aeromonas dhakensis]EIM1709854.1 hypothetical protein [Aeromonas dhakensis]HDZ8877691.1 hypothetical protein [Aeromonas dhakensis]